MARTALRQIAAALSLALLAGFAWALTYVPDPDDPVLPAEERVARLERRSERLATLASEIRRDGESIGQLAAEGKLLEAGLKEKLATFQRRSFQQEVFAVQALVHRVPTPEA